MGFFEKYVKQCRKPSGLLGKFVGRSMNFGHGGIRSWGLSHITVSPQSNILDVGCGGGKTVQELAMLAPDGKVYGIDYSEDMVELSKRINRKLVQKGLVEIRHGNVSSLPFEDDFFDFITAFESYYFWPDLIGDLKEIRRVLKPAGTFLLANEVYKHEKFEKRNSEYVRLLDMMIHTPGEYREFLDEAGYTQIHIDEKAEKNWIAAVSRK